MLQEIDGNSKRANICARCFLWASVSDRYGRIPTNGRQRCSRCVLTRLLKMEVDAAAEAADGPQGTRPHASEIGTLGTAWGVLQFVLVSAAESQAILSADQQAISVRTTSTGGADDA